MSTPLKYHTPDEKRVAINERSKKRYHDNLEKSREYQREWQQKQAHKNPEAAKVKSYSASIRRRYGLTVEQYDAELASQNNLCGLWKIV